MLRVHRDFKGLLKDEQDEYDFLVELNKSLQKKVAEWNKDEEIQRAYKKVERVASVTLLNQLPDYMQPYYREIFLEQSGEEALWRLVKGADKLSALIKCIEEKKAGNSEFSTAYETILESLKKMELPEVDMFMEEFLPSYTKTLDDLQKK